MQHVLNQMLSRYRINTLDEKKNAIKEILQEVVLCGLSRSDFFGKAAFYGGTALRIFYGGDRFSEDLDFSLTAPDPEFDLSKYFGYIEDEIGALGLSCTVTAKDKVADSAIRSAFLKGNTKEHVMTFYGGGRDAELINKQETIKIKIEIDTNPPAGASYETKVGLLPAPYRVRLYDAPSLFAGKIHACLCRDWRSRVKGRDFYDLVFFLSLGVGVNLSHLKERLVESGFLNGEEPLTEEELRRLLNKRFEEVDFRQAREDVLPFVRDKTRLDLWDAEFFTEITKKLKGSE